MKTLKTLKQTIASGLILVSLTGGFQIAQAQGVDKQKERQEALDFSISTEELSKFKKWIEATEQTLKGALTNLNRKTYRIRANILKKAIDEALEGSEKYSETQTRYVLYRLQGAGKILELETHKDGGLDQPGLLDQYVRLLKSGVELALQQLASDKANFKVTLKVETPKVPDSAQFGLRFADMVLKVNESIIDASAQYKLMKITMGWLFKDISRDALYANYAETATQLGSAVKSETDQSFLSDSDFIEGHERLHDGFRLAMLALPKSVKK